VASLYFAYITVRDARLISQSFDRKTTEASVAPYVSTKALPKVHTANGKEIAEINQSL
jgi:hypothetical protein